MNKYIDQLTAMGMNKRGGHVSPHKAIMMLAVMDLVASGETDGNRIVYGPELLEHFRCYFDVVKTEVDSCTPLNPFFYLRSEPFWHHHAVPGREAVCEALGSPGGQKKLCEVIDYVFLDDGLFAALRQVSVRQEMREAIICRYFPAKHDELIRLADKEESVGLYAQVLRGDREEPTCVKEDAGIRDLAFARVVKRAYHYQCAACGLRILFDGISLVDAAHIIPFATSRDDDPCNGSPSFYRSNGGFHPSRKRWNGVSADSKACDQKITILLSWCPARIEPDRTAISSGIESLL